MDRTVTMSKAVALRAASAALLLWLAGCPLTERALVPPESRTEELTDKVSRLERSLEELRRAPPVVPSDTGQRVDTLARSVADLRPQVEEVSRRLAKVEGRIEGVEKAASTAAETARLAGLEGRLSALEKQLVQVGKEVKELAVAKSAPVPAAPPPGAAERPSTPQSLYDDAYILYKKQGKYDEARAKFRAFVDADPSGALAPNAVFWIGETLFDQKQYEQAILEYDRVVQQYPKSGKVPSALLKEAFAFDAIGDPDDARILLKKIVREYPNSDQAALAKKKLEALGEE